MHSPPPRNGDGSSKPADFIPASGGRSVAGTGGAARLTLPTTGACSDNRQDGGTKPSPLKGMRDEGIPGPAARLVSRRFPTGASLSLRTAHLRRGDDRLHRGVVVLPWRACGGAS